MLGKEEYKRELVRMWDSVRDYNKGESSCYSVECDDCVLQHICNSYTQSNEVYHAVEMVETVEKWSKEHSIITNRDKFKEMFGFEVTANYHDCDGILCPNDSIDNDCKECPYNGFWSREYKEPKEK